MSVHVTADLRDRIQSRFYIILSLFFTIIAIQFFEFGGLGHYYSGIPFTCWDVNDIHYPGHDDVHWGWFTLNVIILLPVLLVPIFWPEKKSPKFHRRRYNQIDDVRVWMENAPSTEASVAVNVVNEIILGMIRKKQVERTIDSSMHGIEDKSVQYRNIVNRLKVMTDTMNPVPYPEEKSGTFQVMIPEDQYFDFKVIVGSDDSSVTIQLLNL